MLVTLALLLPCALVGAATFQPTKFAATAIIEGAAQFVRVYFNSGSGTLQELQCSGQCSPSSAKPYTTWVVGNNTGVIDNIAAESDFAAVSWQDASQGNHARVFFQATNGDIRSAASTNDVWTIDEAVIASEQPLGCSIAALSWGGANEAFSVFWQSGSAVFERTRSVIGVQDWSDPVQAAAIGHTTHLSAAMFLNDFTDPSSVGTKFLFAQVLGSAGTGVGTYQADGLSTAWTGPTDMLNFDPNGPVIFAVSSHGTLKTRFLSWVPTVSGAMLELWVKVNQSAFQSTGTGTDQVERGYVAFVTQDNTPDSVRSNIMFSLNVNGTLTVRSIESDTGTNNPLPAPTIINA